MIGADKPLEQEPDVVLFNVREIILPLVMSGVYKGLNRQPSRIFRPDWDGLGIALHKPKTDYAHLHHPLILVDANDETAAGGGNKAENFVLHLKNVVCGNIIGRETDRPPLIVVLSNEAHPRIWQLLDFEKAFKAEPLFFEYDKENEETLSQKLAAIWNGFLHPKRTGSFLGRVEDFYNKNISPTIDRG